MIAICLAVPLLLLLPMLNRQSRWLLGFVLAGMIMAVSAYEVNSLICAALQLSGQTLSIQAAPIVEEILKALPILLFALLISDERRLVFQYAMATGIGFAILENAFLMLTYLDQVNLGWAVIRGFSTSLSHGICTLIVGSGILYVRKQRKLFYTGIFATLTAAMTLHATFNLLMQSPYDTVALLLPIVLYGVYWFRRTHRMTA